MARESAFWNFIKHNLFDWHLQRIETTTGSGVPDLIACYRSKAIWIELKSIRQKIVWIRASQWAWFNKNSDQRCLSIILNRCTKTGMIACWVFRKGMKVSVREGVTGGPSKIKLLDEPTWVCEPKQLKQHMETMLYGTNDAIQRND